MSENNVAAQGRREPSDPLIGSRLGPYQVVRLIGSGGMGRVYQGLQTGPINKKVALKVMRREARTDLMRRRFEMELQTLAALNHPNIARIYLSGTRADGENWFAMEYVEGATLIDYCEQHRLKAPERLKLFKKICEAVHFAHQRGIIHRDLKPANILVREADGEAVPKVIDFGIAKITADEKPSLDQATMVTELTAPGFAVGTLGYMSPEQTRLDEDDIDVRSDIYSLGVILYEMLVGKRPIDEKRIQSGTWDQAFALVRDHEPEKPSKAIRREAMSHTTTLIDMSSVSGLSKYYRGDLDWIVLKAMEKNRERRYQGADLFAEDIENFLNRQPIEAGPPTWTYQSMRFAQRNKALVAGMVLVTAGLIFSFIGLVFGYIEALKKEENAITESKEAKEILETLELFITSQRDFTGPNIRIVDQLDNYHTNTKSNNLNPRNTGKFNLLTGKIYYRLGEYRKALFFLDLSKKNCSEAFGRGHLNTIESHLFSGMALRHLGKYHDAKSELTKSVESLKRTVPPNDERYVVALNEMSAVFFLLGDFKAAERQFTELKEFKWKDVKNQHHHRINFLGNYGAYLKRSGKCKEAIAYLDQAILHSKNKLNQVNYSALISAQNLATCYSKLGEIKKAESIQTFYIKEMMAVYGSDHPEVIIAKLNWAYPLQISKQHHETINLVSSLQEQIRLSNLENHRSVLTAKSNMAQALADLGHYDESINLSEKVSFQKRQHFGITNLSTIHSFATTAYNEHKNGQKEEAIELLRFALRDLIANGKYHEKHIITLLETGLLIASEAKDQILKQEFRCLLFDYYSSLENPPKNEISILIDLE